jgi:hypothetical protein
MVKAAKQRQTYESVSEADHTFLHNSPAPDHEARETPSLAPPPSLTVRGSALAHQRLHGNASLRRKLAPTNAVQRYQAGDTGHEHESAALMSVGFSDEEAEKIYIGNWLRDFSQLMAYDPSFKSRAKKFITPFIGLGEFNQELGEKDLGVYVPSEHMDNPLGGTTLEDPTATTKDDTHLSPDQKLNQTLLDAQAISYKKKAAEAGLPDYIGRSKQHAANMFKRAYGTGRNDAGLRLMGDGLHALEDYFSHTNFTEIAIWTLAQEGDARARAMLAKTGQMEMAGGLDDKGRPKLIAGTYKPGGNDTVSALENVKTQLETKQFLYAVLKGLIRKGVISVALVTEALTKYGVGVPLGVVGGALGGVGGAASGAVEGAGKGMDEGALSGEAWGRSAGASALGGGAAGQMLGEELAGIGHYVGAAGGAIEGGLSGLWEGAKSGAKKGWNFGLDTLGGGAGKGAATATKAAGEAGMVAGKIVLTAAMLEFLMAHPVISGIVYGIVKGLGALIDAKIEAEVKKATAQAAAESPIDPVTKKKTVTHSEIAKDSPEHPIWKSSIGLAEEAVKGVGRVMNDAWASKIPQADLDAKIDTALDIYVSLPSANPWWRSRITQGFK